MTLEMIDVHLPDLGVDAQGVERESLNTRHNLYHSFNVETGKQRLPEHLQSCG